jgi:subtilisin family serine protease
MTDPRVLVRVPRDSPAAGGKVIDASAAIATSGYKVLVMDTGVDKSHPDLNVVEFVDYVDAPGTADYQVDGHGHGSHVGGE